MLYKAVLSNQFCRIMPEINDLRNKMDEITLEMVKLLKTRIDIAKEIGEIKKILEKELQMRLEKKIYEQKLFLYVKKLD